MKKIYMICLIALGLIAAGVLFMSFIAGIAKSFKSSQASNPSIQTEDLKTRQKRTAEQVEDQRKILMENYRQKIEDHKQGF